MNQAVSIFPEQSLPRLAALPWSALEGLSASLPETIAQVLAGEPAAKALGALLRTHRHWISPQRQVAAEAIFGVSLWRRRLAYQLDDTWQTPTKGSLYLFSLLRDLAKLSSQDAGQFLGVDPAVVPAAKAPPQELAVFYSFPDWIAKVLLDFGAEAPALADALNLPGPVFLRVNHLKQSLASLQKQLASEGVESEPCVYARDALRVLSPQPNIYGLACYQRGEFEVQDEGSQLLTSLLEVTPGQTLVDYCAGAGGKTLALASQLQNTGAVFAFDVDSARLQRLQLRAERAGATCVRVKTQATELPMAEGVLVDAPCSELGALRRGPDLRFRLKEDERWSGLQLEILQQASALVKPGGRLVYATCTLRREENQEVIERFLAENKNFQLLALPVYSRFNQEGFFVSLPSKHNTDGFFAARLQRAR